jgi:hypothetical protein
MTIILIAIIFVVGYLAIALEHPLNLNKAASSLITIYILSSDSPELLQKNFLKTFDYNKWLPLYSSHLPERFKMVYSI